jgi:hypothetical protein
MFDGTSVMVNKSKVIQPDIEGDGGVIHGIDTVILPGTFRKCPSMTSSKMSSCLPSLPCLPYPPYLPILPSLPRNLVCERKMQKTRQEVVWKLYPHG